MPLRAHKLATMIRANTAFHSNAHISCWHALRSRAAGRRLRALPREGHSTGTSRACAIPRHTMTYASSRAPACKQRRAPFIQRVRICWQIPVWVQRADFLFLSALAL